MWLACFQCVLVFLVHHLQDPPEALQGIQLADVSDYLFYVQLILTQNIQQGFPV